MKFWEEKYSKTTGVFKIIGFETDPELKEDSKRIAIKKIEYTMKKSVSGHIRNHNQQLNNIWQGKIADKAVAEWLTENGFKTIEYDSVRTNDFKQHDPWDIKIGSQGFETEVRSSCLSKELHNIEYVISNYRLLGTYTIPGFKDSEKGKYLHIQVVYPYTQIKLNQKLRDCERIQGFIVAWATREELINKGERWEYGDAYYLVLKIDESNQIQEIIDFLKQK